MSRDAAGKSARATARRQWVDSAEWLVERRVAAATSGSPRFEQSLAGLTTDLWTNVEMAENSGAKNAETNLGAAGRNACATVGDGLSFL